MNLLSSEEATNVKARRIALASAIKIELADGNQRESTWCPKTAAFHSWKDSLFLRSKSKGTSSLDQMSHRT
jgi:hypothetical protein